MARQKSDSFNRNVKFLDENLTRQTKNVSGKIASASSLDEAKTLFGNDDAAILDALNKVLRDKQIQAAMETVTGGMEEKHVLSFIKGFRTMPDFAGIEKEMDQTDAILAKIKSEPFVLAALKAHCAAKAAEGEDSED
jgi:hypothetical protein